MSKTIGRNQAKKIEAVFSAGTNFRSYSLSNGFSGAAVETGWVRKEFETYRFAKLSARGEGRYLLRVHSNLWYEFESAGGE